MLAKSTALKTRTPGFQGQRMEMINHPNRSKRRWPPPYEFAEKYVETVNKAAERTGLSREKVLDLFEDLENGKSIVTLEDLASLRCVEKENARMTQEELAYLREFTLARQTSLV